MLNLNVSNHMNKLIAMGLLILLAIVGGFIFWLKPANPQNNSQTTMIHATSSSTQIEHQSIAQTVPNIDTSDADHLIQSLEISKDGHLKITKNTQQALDVFLGNSSKTELNGAISVAKDQMYKKMTKPALMEAITLLEHYAAYKKALADMDLSPPQNAQQSNDDNLMAGVKIQQISALRHEYLSPEIVQAFYANDNSNAQYELARQRIMSINGLSDEQRQEELKALQDQLQKPVFN